MKRVTIILDSVLLKDLRSLARKEDSSLSGIVRAAIKESLARRRARKTIPSFVGIGRSRKRDVADRAEELLWTVPRPG
jgi:metal-responsive CopG/Arc/MetJ family transcriptional regulator